MTNLSQQRRKKMLEFLESIKDNTEDQKLKAINELELMLIDKRYGLLWEEHEEAVDKKMEDCIPVFYEDESKKIISDLERPMNFLLEGDNLHSLYLLQKTHKSKIDVIYIDPPYNTRKDGFTYNDILVDENDGFRHSKWLSFMNKRLTIAKELLSPEGVIFISIDENEFATLKLLMDDIFGDKSFIECLIWNKRVPKNDKGIGNIHEYILMYSRTPDLKRAFMVEKEQINEIMEVVQIARQEGKSVSEAEKILKEFYQINNFPRAITLYNNLDNDYRIFGKINMSWPNGNTEGPRYDVIHPITKKPVKKPDRGWRWIEKTFEDKLGDKNLIELHDGSYLCGEIWFAKDEGTQTSSINYLENMDKMLLSSITSLKSDGGMELEKIFGKKNVFSYPKPTKLIERLVSSATYEKKDAIILDFFAGSGTTGHAVINLNKYDNGNRKFILATNNEGGIAENIAYQRLLNVVEGYRNQETKTEVIFRKKLTITDIKKNDSFQKKIEKVVNSFTEGENLIHEIKGGEYLISKNIKIDELEKNHFNLKYFKTDFVTKNNDQDVVISDELIGFVTELVELEFGIDLANNEKIRLILDEDELDELFVNDSIENITLLVPTFVLLTGRQEELLQARNIKKIPIPDYYFFEEMREVGEL